ncbi:uncharacterized protein LOC128258066 [Drosophila gunungcola]|uniref:uncharacterized protein LOC128258066 n=1 Tax=Drosophila gunungcola TaxID=103775 RepID=UPI0022E0B702|nr:uncharacterized protein LOC128258066 [Drosophila gunungcola]
MEQAEEIRVANRSVREVQQNFAESLGYAEEIIWDLLSQEEADLLKKKLSELICDPINETALAGKTPAYIEKYNKNRKKLIADNEKTRQIIFDAVWEQRKYTNRQSLTAIIYVMVVTDEQDVNRAEDSRTFSCHPVFRARRCVSGRSNDSSDCCNLFVDETGRVYQNWEQYVATNELPAGVMVAPEKGIYRLVNDHVCLDKYVTPAGSTEKKVLRYLDTGSVVGSLAAASVPLAALLTLPVSVPVMAAAGVVGLASAGYATARSSIRLVDRSQHEQSINVTDRVARGHWLGVIAGAVGLGAAGATTALTAATNAGREVGAITQLTVNGMNISSIVVSGTGVANGVLDLILKVQDGDDITGMDVLQLSASLVLFTHSVYNFKLASTIINESPHRNVAGYRNTLSSRMRRTFDKISKETFRLLGNSQGKMDIIRSANEMPSQFNDQESDAHLLIGPSSQPRQEPSTYAAGVYCLQLSSVVIRGVTVVLRQYGTALFEHVVNAESFANHITKMAANLEPDVFDFIMNLTRTFMDTMLDELTSVLKFFIPTESVLSSILLQVWKNYRHLPCKLVEEHTGAILAAVRRYFLSLNPNSYTDVIQKCPTCVGTFSISHL